LPEYKPGKFSKSPKVCSSNQNVLFLSNYLHPMFHHHSFHRGIEKYSGHGWILNMDSNPIIKQTLMKESEAKQDRPGSFPTPFSGNGATIQQAPESRKPAR
jgi:hypothetical protein